MTTTRPTTRRGYDFVQAELKARATRAAKKAAAEAAAPRTPATGDRVTYTNRRGDVFTGTVLHVYPLEATSANILVDLVDPADGQHIEMRRAAGDLTVIAA